MFLSKVFIHHLCLRFFLLASLLITINAAPQIIKYSSELDIVAFWLVGCRLVNHHTFTLKMATAVFEERLDNSQQST
jgi:hypothetical protein